VKRVDILVLALYVAGSVLFMAGSVLALVSKLQAAP
jgi:hypothetical protein